MFIGDRLREMREAKNFSQGEIEKRTGLLRCYISRVENGHTVPSIDTLAKMAAAFGIPLYQFFYDGRPTVSEVLAKNTTSQSDHWGASGREARFLDRLRECLSQMSEGDQKLLLSFTQILAHRKRRNHS